jgi:hypothetical protein
MRLSPHPAQAFVNALMKDAVSQHPISGYEPADDILGAG